MLLSIRRSGQSSMSIEAALEAYAEANAQSKPPSTLSMLAPLLDRY